MKTLIDANYKKGRGGQRVYKEYAPTLPARMFKGGFYIVEDEDTETERTDRRERRRADKGGRHTALPSQDGLLL